MLDSVGMRSNVLAVVLLLLCSIFTLPVVALDAPPDGTRSIDDSDVFALQPCPTRCFAAQEQARHNSHSTVFNSTNTDGSAPTAAGARIFYLILVHNERTANDAVFLFRAIRDPRNTIAIHYDRKVEHLLHRQNSTLLREVNECPCGSRVVVQAVHAVEWSQWSMNQPTLWGMALAVQSFHNWDVFINLSGDTLAVYSADAMARRVAELTRRNNFVTSRSCETGLVPTSVNQFPKFWHKRRHYTLDETEPDPVFTYAVTNASTTSRRSGTSKASNQQYNKTLTIHFGSQWVILRRSFVEWLVRQLQDESSWPSQFQEYLIQSQKLMTDETFIPTILMHANKDDGYSEDFSDTIPVVSATGSLVYTSNDGDLLPVQHVRFERMDEHMPTSYGVFPETQRYQVPESLIASNQLEQPKVWGPYFLGVYDLGALRQSGALFARKVSALVDANLVQILPVDDAADIPHIVWPKDTEISLTPRPDWNAELCNA